MAVSGCTGVPFCRLKGYQDLLSVTKRVNPGQALHGEPIEICVHVFKTCQSGLKKPCDSPVTEQSVIEDLHSEGYTKARSLGLTVCLTADLEKLNLTAKYCGPEQGCTVRCNCRS